MKFFFKPSIIYFLLSSTFAQALTTPLKDIMLLPGAVATEAVRVSTARVLIADYALIRRDFPEVRLYTETQIDEWLLNHTAFVSASQRTLGGRHGVNRKMSIDKSAHTIGYRPPLYGRALVFKAGSGLIDAKGVGAKNPTLEDDSNGLLELNEAAQEYTIEKLIHAVFQHSGSGYDTIENYGVMSLGFLEKSESRGHWYPAGILLRQAHIRTTENWTCFNSEKSIKIENLLRRYGITSVGAVDHINIQGSAANAWDGDAIIDFSSYSHVLQNEKEPLFKDPLKDFIPTWDREVVIASPDSPEFVQPDLKLLVDRKFFESYFVNPWIKQFQIDPTAVGGHFPALFHQNIQNELSEQWRHWKENMGKEHMEKERMETMDLDLAG